MAIIFFRMVARKNSLVLKHHLRQRDNLNSCRIINHERCCRLQYWRQKEGQHLYYQQFKSKGEILFLIYFDYWVIDNIYNVSLFSKNRPVHFRTKISLWICSNFMDNWTLQSSSMIVLYKVERASPKPLASQVLTMFLKDIMVQAKFGGYK